MEEAFFDTPLYKEFAQLPDESTVLRFRHRLEKHKLNEQILPTVDEGRHYGDIASGLQQFDR